MLTDAQIQQFDATGLLVLPGLADPARVLKVREHLAALRAQTASAAYFNPQTPDGVLMNPHAHEPLFMQLVAQPAIRDALTQLLRAPAMICQSMLFFTGSRSRPHQDEFFMSPRPAPLIGSWIALQDVSPDAGPLGAIPGSHLGPAVLAGDIQGQWWKDPQVFASFFDKVATICDASRIEPLPVRQGDVIFFHGRLIHCGIEPRDPHAGRWSMVSHHCRSDATMDDSNNGIRATPVRM